MMHPHSWVLTLVVMIMAMLGLTIMTVILITRTIFDTTIYYILYITI